MKRAEFKEFVEQTLEAVIQLAEQESGRNLPRKIVFRWFSQTTAEITEDIPEYITRKVYIDEAHIYPCVDIGVGDILRNDTLVICANIAGYAPRPFGKNWQGQDGPFIHIIGYPFIDKMGLPKEGFG